MSPHSEQPQHHIANISYQQHPSPPQAGQQSSTSPTMKLKGSQNISLHVVSRLFDVFYISACYCENTLCQTASQLAVCMNLLDKKIIAWKKSATKVFCSECRRVDNESLLLLCDGCDKGRHTYCCTVSKFVKMCKAS